MADKDLNSIVEQLITALKSISSDKAGKTFTAQDKSKAEETSEKSAGNIREIFAAQERNSAEIEKNMLLTQKHAENTIDAEQIINELKEERIRQITEEYRENQLVLLQLRKKLEEAEKDKNISEKALELLREKIGLYEEETKEQAKILEGHKKEKELKEGILSIGKEILQGAKQYGGELEKHIIQLNVLNGGAQDYNGSIRESSRLMYASSVGTGLSIEELNKASQSLSQTMIGLSSQTANSVKDMGNAVAQLGKLGVDAATASRSFDSLVNAMGKTPQQAVKIQDSFIQMAAKNRLALGSVTQAFAENSNRFVGYGEQMTKVLDGLAEQSLKTGIAIGKLVGIAQGFDTFEDASRKVGNLNALLGGDYFNSIELLTATDEERIKLLKEGVAASGIQFESMNRFQKMAIANAAGISDLNEAAKLFGQTSLQNTRQQAEGVEVQKTLSEQAQSATLAMDKLKSSFNGLILILEPSVTVLMKVVGAFSKLVQGMNDVFSGGGKFPVIGAIITSTLLYAMYSVIRLRGAFGSLIQTIAGGVVNAVKTAATAIMGIPKPPSAPPAAGASPVSSATSGLLSNAGNMLKAAGAILIFAAALWVLAKALQEFSSKEINDDGIKRAGVSMVALLAIMLVLDKAKSEITKGAIVVGIMSLSLLAFGLSLGIMSKVDWKLIGVISVALLGLGLAIAGLGLLFSGPQAITLGIGIAILLSIAGVLTILGLAIKTIIDSLKEAAPAFTNLTDSLTKLFAIKDLKQNFSDLESFFSQLSNINVEPINNLANAIYNLATNLQTLAAIPSKMGINVTGKTDLAETINKTVASAAEATSAVSQASSRTAAQTLIPAQQTTAFVPLIVQIDKKTIVQILQKDIESIAKGTALDTISAVGIVQSNSNIQDLLSGYTPAEQG